MPTFDSAETRKKIVEVIAQELKVDASTISDTTTLESLGADSLDIVQIIMKLEEVFGIEISDDDAEKLQTLSMIVAYVQERRTK